MSYTENDGNIELIGLQQKNSGMILMYWQYPGTLNRLRGLASSSESIMYRASL